MLKIALDRLGFEEVVKAMTDLAYNNKTYAFKTGTMFREKQSRFSVHDLFGFMELIKDDKPDLYSVLEKSIATSLITQITNTNQSSLKINGIPKKKAQIIDAIHQTFADLKLSGLDHDILTKANKAGVDLVAVKKELRDNGYLFDSNTIYMKRGECKTWREIFQPYKHKTSFIKVVDQFAMRHKKYLTEFIAGLVSRTDKVLEITLITGNAYGTNTQAIEKELTEKGYNPSITLVPYASKASTAIHSREVITENIWATFGSGVDNIRDGKVYRNEKNHIIGKYYKGGVDYKIAKQSFDELESGGMSDKEVSIMLEKISYQ